MYEFVESTMKSEDQNILQMKKYFGMFCVCDGFAFVYVCVPHVCLCPSMWEGDIGSLGTGVLQMVVSHLVGFLELTRITSVIETIFHCFIIFTCFKPKSMQRLKYYRIFSWMECFKINILDQQDNSLPRGYGGTWAPKSSPNGVKPRRNTHGTLLWVAPEPVPHHFSSYLVNENVVTWPGMLRNLVD